MRLPRRLFLAVAGPLFIPSSCNRAMQLGPYTLPNGLFVAPMAALPTDRSASYASGWAQATRSAKW